MTFVVKPHLRASDVKTRIEGAFRRSAEIDANHITLRPATAECC
jgi:hypothetical protein